MRGAITGNLADVPEGERWDPERFAEKRLRLALNELNQDIEKTQSEIEDAERTLQAKREGLEAAITARESLERAIGLISDH